MLPELTQEEFSAALDRAASEALLAAGKVRPPVDAFALAERLGLRVAFDDRQCGRGRFVRLKCRGRGSSCGPNGSILVRPDPRGERLQWAVAHEIGETLAERVFQMLGVDTREAPANIREGVANHLAGRLLLPLAWFKPRAVRAGWNLLELKRVFSTASHELIARRMLDFEPAVVITIFDHSRLSWRRGNTCFKPGRMSDLESHCRLKAHETGQPQQDEDHAQAVWAWPVHEEGWKREILRTQLPSEDCYPDGG